jgi:cytochrome c6
MPPVRRLGPVAILLPLLALAVGCSTSKPGGRVTTPTPTKVVGTVPQAETAKVPVIYQHGDPTAGKVVFTSVGGCGSCHTLADAGTKGQVGPNLDQLHPGPELVTSQVTNGGGGMPAFANKLSKEQIKQVADYVSSAAGR